MSKKHLYMTVATLILLALLAGAWWGWSKAGLAVLQLEMGVC